MYGEKPTGTIFVRCSTEEAAGIAAAAAADGRSVSDYVRRMLAATLRAIAESEAMIKGTKLVKARTRRVSKRPKVKRGSAVVRSRRRGGKKQRSKRARGSK